MSKNTQDDIVIRERHGLPVYAENPSIPDVNDIKRDRPKRFGNDKTGFIVDGGNGEVLSTGSIGFYQWEEIDDTRFVKMFLAGIKQAASLSKSGLSVFEFVYQQMQESPKCHEIKLSAEDTDLTAVTFRRGLRELLEKEFLYLTKYQGVFFVNIRYMFNGDRLAFIKGYRRKGSAQQGELPLIESGEE